VQALRGLAADERREPRGDQEEPRDDPPDVDPDEVRDREHDPREDPEPPPLEALVDGDSNRSVRFGFYTAGVVGVVEGASAPVDMLRLG
jgi:hypothetical protein